MHARGTHLFEVLDKLDERLGGEIHWSNPPRLKEWGRFVLRAYIILSVSLLLFLASLIGEIWHPYWLGHRWIAALFLLGFTVTCIGTLLFFITSPWFQEHIALPLTLGAFAFLLLAASLARKQIAKAGGQQ
jgi:hypothetical protein